MKNAIFILLILFFANTCFAATAVIDVGSQQNFGYTVCFDGSRSTGENSFGTPSPDVHGIETYQWNFDDGDGNESSTYYNTRTHVYASNGTYTVTLKVTDYNGAIDTTSTNVTISTLSKQTVSGTTTAAINSAISALGGSPGIVYFPANTYSITSQITVPAGVIMEGAGNATTILNLSSNGFYAGGSNIRVTGFEFVGSDGSNNGILAYTDKRNCYVDHCKIRDLHQGITVSYEGSATIEYCNIYSCNVGWSYGIIVARDAYVMVRHNDFAENRHSITGSGDNTNVMNTGFDFHYNTINDDETLTLGKVAPIDMHSGGHGRIRVCDNTIKNCKYGMSFRDGWGELRRNTFENTDTSGYVLRLSPPTRIGGGSLIGTGIHDLYFDNNDFTGAYNWFWLQYGTNCYINCRLVDDLYDYDASPKVEYKGTVTWNYCELPPGPEDTFACHETNATITIDGQLLESDWSNAEFISFSNFSQSDNTAKIYTLWDSTNLYFAFEITDSSLEAVETQEDGAVWSDDNAEIYLDTLNDKASALQTDDYQYVVSINNIVYDARGTGTTRDSSWDDSLQSANTTSGTGYILEIKIPWADINVTPVVDKEIGLLLANGDRDSGAYSTYDWLNIIDEVGDYAKPNLWGTLTLISSYTPPAQEQESFFTEGFIFTGFTIDLGN